MTQYFVPDRNIRNIQHFARNMEIFGLSPTRAESFNYSNRHTTSGWMFTKEEIVTLSMAGNVSALRGSADAVISSIGMRDGRDGCKWMHSDYALTMFDFASNREREQVYCNYTHLHDETHNAQHIAFYNAAKALFDDTHSSRILWTRGPGKLFPSTNMSGHGSYAEIASWGSIGSLEYTQTLPESVFGIRYPFRLKGLKPYEQSTFNLVVDGITLAQYFAGEPGTKPRLLFLFPLQIIDIIPSGGEIMIKAMQEVNRLLNTVESFTEEMYKAFQTKALTKAVLDHQNNLTRAEAKVKERQTQFFNALKTYNESKLVVTTYETGLAKKLDATQFGAELDAIKSLSAVEAVSFSPRKSGIIISTKVLKCIHPKTKAVHEIGAFDINVNIDADINGALIWTNKTRTPNGKHAPHIGADGKAALGNMAEMLPEILGSGDLKLIAQIAIQFVESVNLSDEWGKTISDYPVVENAIVQASAEAAAA